MRTSQWITLFGTPTGDTHTTSTYYGEVTITPEQKAALERAEKQLKQAKRKRAEIAEKEIL